MKHNVLNLIKQANPSNPLSYAHDIVRDYAREKLDSYIDGCKDCSICEGHKSLTKGNANAGIMVIGESVAEDQIDNPNQIYPLEGTEGQVLLEKVFDHFNVNPDEIFYINAVNCFPYKKIDDQTLSRTPSKKEVDNCKVFLEYAIDIVKPTVIILLGSVALNVFHKNAITKVRGQWIDIKGISAMPTFHPEYFIQIEGKKHPDIIEEHKIDFCEDIKNALLSIQERYPNNNILLEPIEE